MPPHCLPKPREAWEARRATVEHDREVIGAADYLHKPIDQPRLVASLERLR